MRLDRALRQRLKLIEEDIDRHSDSLPWSYPFELRQGASRDPTAALSSKSGRDAGRANGEANLAAVDLIESLVAGTDRLQLGAAAGDVYTEQDSQVSEIEQGGGDSSSGRPAGGIHGGNRPPWPLNAAVRFNDQAQSTRGAAVWRSPGSGTATGANPTTGRDHPGVKDGLPCVVSMSRHDSVGGRSFRLRPCGRRSGAAQ